jgi:iron complex transport system permease protein
LCIFFLLELILGSVNIPLADTFSILLGKVVENEGFEIIILQSRLPRAIAAAFGGAGLAVAGLQMQTLFRNPLAGPFILGISSGASLGVALVILISGGAAASTVPELLRTLGFAGNALVVVAAFLGSSAVLMAVLFVSRRIENSVTILILGLMFGYITSSMVTVLVHFSNPEQVKAFMEWSYGSFDVQWGEVSILIPVTGIALVMAFLLSKDLNALLLGEKYATSMGLDVNRARTFIIINTALLAGIVTAFCGPISFLGVAVPHLCRGLFRTADHGILIPACIIVGGALSLFSDMIAHLPGSNYTLPLNAITSLLGAPVVIWIILHGNKQGRGVSV